MINKKCFTTEWINTKSIIEDIRNTSLNITTRGMVDKGKFNLLQKGINNIKPFMYKSQYRIEEAIVAKPLVSTALYGVLRSSATGPLHQ